LSATAVILAGASVLKLCSPPYPQLLLLRALHRKK
jgi:hypothetical protein